jgi:hypothetical protein
MPQLSYRMHFEPVFRRFYLEDEGYHERLARLAESLKELRETPLEDLTEDDALRILDRSSAFGMDFRNYCKDLDRRATHALSG